MATTSSKHRVEIVTRVDRQEFLENLLGASGTDWDWWMTVKFDEGFDWDTHPTDIEQAFLTLGIEDPEDDEHEIVLKLSSLDLVRSHNACLDMGHHVEWDNHDASSADCVFQMALLGAVVYG
jgi:hypothetical protein